MRLFNAYTDYLKREFGCRVQKLSINAGFSCPNRDGKLGTGGCIYCDNKIFSPSYTDPQKSIRQQLLEGMDFHKIRYKTEKYFAYFQSFSNTYAPLEVLQQRFEEALSVEKVIGLIIGTRPDCIDEKKLDYLAELAKNHYIMVEYGIESCYDKTLKTIHRGHDFATAQKAVLMTVERNMHCGAHFIFGLPNETETEMMEMVHIINQMPIETIKFHQLQIIRETEAEQMYRKNPEIFPLFSNVEAYVDFIIRFIEQLNPDIMIDRFASEVKPELVVAPCWENLRYDQLLVIIEAELAKRKSHQGNNWKSEIYIK
ncbi:MAG: TIGR01212 family radical SAM protein [Bacteroidales bacterium]|nr:TIGR01212 family radical SAM protein [Bacteroidales bacterium]